jgi:hypothetical protein
MSDTIKNINYNPELFLKENIHKIIPRAAKLERINFSGYKKKAFHSQDRPSGLVVVDYFNIKNNKKRLKIFVKHHPNACKIHDRMSAIYEKLEMAIEKSHMPKPYICDQKQNANFMEYFKGTDLKYNTFINLLLNREHRLKEVFQNIGRWLNSFHQSTRLNKTVEVSNEKQLILNELKSSTFFNEEEKNVIREFLISNINPESDYLFLIKPHNDFSLRNIIHTELNDFIVIDWDAMFHMKFPSEAPIWNDITTFVLNLQSFSRFSPLIKGKDIQLLTDSFIDGYFYHNQEKINREEIDKFLYLFTLKYFLGIIGDRSLPEIYKGKLGHIYIKNLKKHLLEGKIMEEK